RQPGFHIEHARSPKPPLRFAERHGAKSSSRPDGIGVSENQNLFLAGAAAEFGPQVLSESSAPIRANACDVAPFGGKKIDEAIHRGGIIAGRFAFHHALNQRNNLALILSSIAPERIHYEMITRAPGPPLL